MISCTLFAIGAELLEGSVTDTNSGFIARALGELGVTPVRIEALPDKSQNKSVRFNILYVDNL